MSDRSFLRCKQHAGIRHIGQHLIRAQIKDPAETTDQMNAVDGDSVERKIGKIDKEFG